MDWLSAQWMQRLNAEIAWAYALRLALALAGVMALGWSTGRGEWMVPLLLGAFAAALAEVDDSWRGRVRAMAVTLACFGVVGFSVTWLADKPLALLGALLACSFVFTLLGAIGGRYRAIASSTIILALYAALSETADAPLGVPASVVASLLLAGAAWYGWLSILWCLAVPLHPVRHGLADLYLELAGYLRLKAAMFEPVRGLDIDQRRLALAQANAGLVAALNSSKESLLARTVPGQAPQGALRALLNLYFLAQDIHERASASHYPYDEWTGVLFHSDVLYRCQRVLQLQGMACEALGNQLARPRGAAAEPAVEAQAQALSDLHASLAYLDRQSEPAWQVPLRSLRAVARNLDGLGAQLVAATAPLAVPLHQDASLQDPAPRSLAEAWARVRAQLNVRSAVFRHAVRLSLALAASWGAMQWAHPSHGYWIMLTTLIVCQPTYGATMERLVQRMAGTVLGLLAGWALMKLFPASQVQALLALAAAVLYFLLRTRRYVSATAAITLMVLLLFNQSTGQGHALILPRLLDTIAGALIATAALLLVLPDWQGRRLGAAAADALDACARYLRQIVPQYATGRADDLDYRVARRTAHNADAALSATLSHVLREPPWVRRHARAGAQLLVHAHALLGYLSALGAHRDLVAAPAGVQADPLAAQAAEQLSADIEGIARALRDPEAPGLDGDQAAQLGQRLQALSATGDTPSLLHAQLVQAGRQIAPLRTAARHLLEGVPVGPPAS